MRTLELLGACHQRSDLRTVSNWVEEFRLKTDLLREHAEHHRVFDVAAATNERVPTPFMTGIAEHTRHAARQCHLSSAECENSELVALSALGDGLGDKVMVKWPGSTREATSPVRPTRLSEYSNIDPAHCV